MVALGFLALFLLSAVIPNNLNLDTASLSEGTYSRMSLRYEKRILFFTVDVLDVEIRFGPTKRQEFNRLLEAQGRLSAKLEQQVASTAISAGNALVRVRFLRRIDLERFIQEARYSTKLAYQSGLIEVSELKRVNENLPKWYAPLRNRDILEGDQMFYRIQHHSMHTVFVGAEGRVYVDQVDEGEAPGRTLLAGYLAPRSEFRTGLIQSLVDSGL